MGFCGSPAIPYRTKPNMTLLIPSLSNSDTWRNQQSRSNVLHRLLLIDSAHVQFRSGLRDPSNNWLSKFSRLTCLPHLVWQSLIVCCCCCQRLELSRQIYLGEATVVSWAHIRYVYWYLACRPTSSCKCFLTNIQSEDEKLKVVCHASDLTSSVNAPPRGTQKLLIF